MSSNVVLWIGVGSTVAGTVGGALEKVCKPGGAGFRIGAFLASLGIDLVSLRKLGGAS